MQPFKYRPKINTGELRSRIDVYGNIKYINELGETAYRFDKLNSIWAKVAPRSGRLISGEANTEATEITHKITVYYSAGKDITKDMQIRYKDHRFEIIEILNPFFKNEKLEISCKELID